MIYSWEGKRRSGVVLAMRHRLSGICGLSDLRNGDEHPAYSPVWTTACLPYLTFKYEEVHV